MIEGYNPVFQAFLGTLFTWTLTALGSALVFVFRKSHRNILDGSLGFAAGVMLAASYWSLLAPAIEMAETSGQYGESGQYAFVPVAVGFFLGALFVYGADKFLPYSELAPPVKEKDDDDDQNAHVKDDTVAIVNADSNRGKLSQRKKTDNAENHIDLQLEKNKAEAEERNLRWRRILLLVVAITVHNIPEGLAVGVAFGAIGKTSSATFGNARNLAIGIGIQNFPEGLSVSMPLRGCGFARWKSFMYGQFSGMVEPIAGVLGALAVVVAEPILPYALAFAAGAMVYVVVDDIIPEPQSSGNGRLASWTTILGFIVMMSLDVALG